MEWLVKNALQRDVERQHLNKILQDIRATINALDTRLSQNSTQAAAVRATVAAMIMAGQQKGIDVTYNSTNNAIDFTAHSFTIQLSGDVTGTATVQNLSNVNITTTIDPSAKGIGEAPVDGNAYWRQGGGWVQVPLAAMSLANVEAAGWYILDADYNWVAREIEGTADEIDVTNGDAAAGNPIVSLAALADTGVGTFKLITRDAKGRIEGSLDGTTDDVPEGVSNLYFPEAPINGSIYGRKDGGWVVVPGGGGGGGVDSVTGGTGIDVDNTDPANPIVELDAASIASLALADTAVQPGDLATVATTGDYNDLINTPTIPTAGGITVTGGSKDGAVLTVGTTFSAILPSDYTLTGDWFLWCDPTGSISLDVWVDDYSVLPPVVGDSIVGGNYPAVVAGIKATDDYTGWTDTTLTAGQAITIEVRSVSAVKWFTFTMQATRS